VRLVALSSGSKGNATLVELGGARLLIDAGLSCRELTRRLTDVGVAPGSLDGVLLSHEHEDHARGVERFSRRHGVPVFCSPQTLEALDLSPVHLAAWRPLPEGRAIEIGPLEVEAFPVPHDAARPVAFVLRGAGLRLGLATDLGRATGPVIGHLAGCDLLLIEFNHDERLLREGPYPPSVKARVAGGLGHLSNDAAADLLRQTVDGQCRAVVLAHLSETNNRPDLARRAAGAALADAGRARIGTYLARGDAAIEVRL
jgi:phosphoribosyl 1,2-cyclic phosphodiesterase